jgi:AraC-like DNA-binding protein
VVIKGTGTRFIGDSIKSFKAGELILTGPHLPHLWRSDEAYFQNKSKLYTEGIVIYFPENLFSDAWLEKEEINSIKRLLQKSARGLEFYGATKTEVIALMSDMPSVTGFESVLQFFRILLLLSTCKEYHFISHATYADPSKKVETDRMNKVYAYVLKNYKAKVLLQDAANIVCMTPTSFSRYFTKKNNKTFSRFVSEIRVKHACKLLTETDKTVAQVSLACGFNTLSNFNKQFKEIMLKRPFEYKKEFMNL